MASSSNGREIISIGRTIESDVPTRGTYTVREDCSGTESIFIAGKQRQGVITIDFVNVDHKKEMKFIVMTEGFVLPTPGGIQAVMS